MSVVVPLIETEQIQLRYQYAALVYTRMVYHQVLSQTKLNYLHVLLDPLGEGEAVGIASSHGDHGLVRPIEHVATLLLKRTPGRDLSYSCKINSESLQLNRLGDIARVDRVSFALSCICGYHAKVVTGNRQQRTRASSLAGLRRVGHSKLGDKR